MRQFGFVLLSILLAGCASGPLSAKSDLESSSQQQGKVISCSGYKNWPDCNSAAAKACPNGYEVLAKEESAPQQTRSLRINCR